MQFISTTFVAHLGGVLFKLQCRVSFLANFANLGTHEHAKNTPAR